MIERSYTTDGSVSKSVRPQVWKDWKRFWRRLYRGFSARDRLFEFMSGTVITVENTDFLLQYKPATGTFEISLRDLRFEDVRETVKGSLSSNGKPYTFMDDFQKALDSLVVQSVMAS